MPPLSRHASPTALAWHFPDWSPSNYVFLPAGAYAGNRFPSLPLPYSPRIPEAEVRGVATRPIITDIPRLNDGPGPSRLRLATGDLAFPAFGCFDPDTRRAWLVLARDPRAAADWNFEIEENADRTAATFRIAASDSTAPAVVNEHTWDCPDLPAFFEHVFALRAALASAAPAVPASLPFSAAFALIEEHYHRDNWREALSLFAVEPNSDAAYPFQTGWCGGMIATYPLLANGSALSRQRARRNLDAFFQNAPRPGGLFAGRCTRDGRWTADFALDSARPYTNSWTLVRRQADALHYLLRQVAWVEASGETISPTWHATLLACAESFVSIWQRHGQLGQFVHELTGDILVGGSASGALVPGALALASARYRRPDLLAAAAELGEFFACEFLARGVTTGGPGDAAQCPDSESVAALVESYALLHEATGEPRWLAHGRAAATQLATWVMPYDFAFPAGTEFARLDIRTRGSVFANTQNKHSAPGICTHAGAGLLRLFRATGDTRLMDLLRDIARFIPQCVSRPDRPIHDKAGRPLPFGWINERVNTSAWDNNVGGVFHGSTWAEVSLLLTTLELPGVYVRPDLGRVWCLDHVEATLTPDGALTLSNPTAFPARVRVLVENNNVASRPLPPYWFASAEMIDLPAGSLFRRDLR